MEAALAIAAESAMAKYGAGELLTVLPAAFTKLVAVSIFAPWNVTEPLTADTALSFEYMP